MQLLTMVLASLFHQILIPASPPLSGNVQLVTAIGAILSPIVTVWVGYLIKRSQDKEKTRAAEIALEVERVRLNQIKETAKLEAIRQAVTLSDKKLTVIARDTSQSKSLLNGIHGNLLRDKAELAERIVADAQTPSQVDIRAAELARKAYEEHLAAVAAASEQGKEQDRGEEEIRQGGEPGS